MSSSARFTNEGLAGPHSSRLANAADPRVDSDLDSTQGNGVLTTGTGHHTAHGHHNTSGTTYASTGSTNAGPHNSNIVNKLDPTVDSDLDGRRNVGNNQGGLNTTSIGGGISNSTNAGPHDSNLANKMDPRVDSDLDGRGNRHGAVKGGIFGASGSHATPGSGTAQNTAGPHNSDLLNKLDPRVDSNLDGSTTLGGNRTRS